MQSKTLEQTLAAIDALDLEPIKFKATRSEDGYGWTPEYAEAMAQAYKRYLVLHAKYPELTLAPDQDTDRFWHMHILDTRKYAADCDAMFGEFLHHFPYLGLRGEDDERALQDAFAQMQTLLAREFGEGAVKASAWCAVEGKAAWCAAEGPAAAWCAVESKSAAWCAVESKSAAWCAVESKSAAWCAVESKSAAWCALESETKQQAAAWCALETPANKAAWCAVESKAKSEAKAAWCALETDAQPSAAWCAVEGKVRAA